MLKNGPKRPKMAKKRSKMANFRDFPMIGTFPEKTSNGWNFFAPVPA